MTDPIAALAAVVKAAQERVELGHMVSFVRRIDESDKETLKRLMRERAAVTEMFREHGIRNEPFDHDYKDNFFEALEKLVKKAR